MVLHRVNYPLSFTATALHVTIRFTMRFTRYIGFETSNKDEDGRRHAWGEGQPLAELVFLGGSHPNHKCIDEMCDTTCSEAQTAIGSSLHILLATS